ncbi:putative farnesyl-diphosphate farnesyltransferase, partial [Hortaea werneckii]
NKEKALQCQSEMILLALSRADECLFYMAGVKEQSVFNFVAIPQTMAIATLELCFQNYAMFQRNIKITKGQACELMMQSTQNLQLVCDQFRKYARKIHRKNNPRDPHFLDISIACGNIERFIETIFPTQTARTLPQGEGQADAATPAVAQEYKSPEEIEREKKASQEARRDIFFVMFAVFITLSLVSVCMIGAAWFFGARFDLAFQALRDGNFAPASPKERAAMVKDAIMSTSSQVASSASEAVHSEL